jgi:formylglycine-generating enzyme required for sulfatase activity
VPYQPILVRTAAILLAAAVFKDPVRQAVGRTPPGMVWIPGGEFVMGADEPDRNHVGRKAAYDARPGYRVYVDGFYMDKTDVTNDEYARFVNATGYLTVAERTPQPEEFPGAPSRNRVPESLVFTARAQPVTTEEHWWSYVRGANWRHPLGPASDLTGIASG